MDKAVGEVFDLLRDRFRRKDDIRDAVQVQDELRSRSGSWSGEEEVKKWRKRRYSS